jgi:YHS domain-containing protein
MIKRILTAVLGAGLLLSPVAAFAESDPVYTNWRDNVAAEGYDVVTFFSGKPQEGKPEFTTRYEGADWYFFTQANKDLFLTNPELFAPQYGGYCAWAVAKGKLAPGRAEHWFVEDGRLFFNYNARIKRRWEKKRAKFILNADARWPDILDD